MERINPKNCYVVIKMTRPFLEGGIDSDLAKSLEEVVKASLETQNWPDGLTFEVTSTILEPGVAWPPGLGMEIRPIFKEY